MKKLIPILFLIGLIVLSSGCVQTKVENIPDVQNNDTRNYLESVVMFHNGKGPMCLEALDFFEEIDCPLEQHLDTEEGFRDLLNEKKSGFTHSEGVSNDFGYYPIIFVKNKAYSGFNENVKNAIKNELGI